MAKKRAIGRYPQAFRKMAVERLKSCDNIVALSQELGVHRRLLYKWRDQLEPIEDGEGPPANSRESWKTAVPWTLSEEFSAMTIWT